MKAEFSSAATKSNSGVFAYNINDSFVADMQIKCKITLKSLINEKFNNLGALCYYCLNSILNFLNFEVLIETENCSTTKIGGIGSRLSNLTISSLSIEINFALMNNSDLLIGGVAAFA